MNYNRLKVHQLPSAAGFRGSNHHSLRNVTSTEKIVVGIQSILYYLEDCDIYIFLVFKAIVEISAMIERTSSPKRQLAKIWTFDVVPLSHWKHLAWEKTVSAWNTEFLALPKALKTYFPTIYQRLKCKKFFNDFKLSQILAEHGHFKSYLSRFNLIGSDICFCGQDAETVEHVLLYCNLYFCKRESFKKELEHTRLGIS
ncbi:hypothetical protein TNCV_4004261 [Trichonephila clavipes]|nr:hypothetical protein TNCV_4004261 [Trichonephila clavipes]